MFLHVFAAQADNEWLLQDRYLSRVIVDFFKELPEQTIKQFSTRPLVLVPITGHLSCAIGEKDAMDIILIFPELLRKLRSANPRLGLAVLAHEIGHLYHRHSVRKIDRLQAQVEADRYACELGYALELLETLEAFTDLDTKVRITYITADYLSKKNA